MKKTIGWIMLLVMLVSSFVFTVLAAPGSSEDPVISLSYITDILWPEIKEYVDNSKAQNLPESGNGHITPEGMEYSDTFKVVSLTAGQKLIGGDGCEVILRSGNLAVIASERGGVSDVTAGIDLPGGTLSPANHLMIIPVNDGRGFIVNADSYVMVKGDYKIA